VEHPCPKCGTAVEDGTPFCRHCRAPQIRVVIEPTVELPAPPVQNLDTSALARTSPVFTPAVPHLPSPELDWSHGLPCAAMGGFLALFLSFIPLFLFGPAFLAAGAFAAFLYRRRTLIHLNRRAGARLGAASGGFAFLFLSVVIVATVFYAPDKIREAMATQLKTGHYDPEAARSLMNFVNTNVGLAACLIFSLLIILLICVVGASIGGAWYSAWLQKRDRG
jgi:hypothetical protein